MSDYNDYPKEELIKSANEILAKDPRAQIQFKLTCENCGERIFAAEPNMVRDRYECCNCGATTEFKKGNYAVIWRLNEPKTESREGTQAGIRVRGPDQG